MSHGTTVDLRSEVVRLGKTIIRKDDELIRFRSINAELLAACHNFRDAVLWGRYQLEEPCLDSDQTNAVLDLFDDLVGAVTKNATATTPSEEPGQ